MELELQNVSLSYGGDQTYAVRDFSFCFTEGVYGLLGPNGAGKTTLMNLLVGNLNPTEGSITYNHKDIYSLQEKYRRRIGYMPQMQGLFDDFTGERFLWYMAGLKGLGRKEGKEQIDRLFSVVNLEGERYRKIKGYSGGMKQRLLLAQALLNDPKILILDEPTAGLDPQERIRIRNYISTLSENRLVLLATHIVSDVESIAREMIFMKEGRLLLSGSPAETLKGMEGHVFEVLVPQDRAEIVTKKNVLISNVNHTAGGVLYRAITKHPPDFGQVYPVRPTTEDLYLLLMHEKQGANMQ